MKAQSSFRLFPMPLHSIFLLLVWLGLNNTLAPGHIVLGGILAFLIPLVVAGLHTPQPRVQRYGLACRYVLMVMYDIVVANIEVAIRILGPMKNLKPGFVAVPIETHNELMLTILASTISLTPGTVSAEVTKDRKWLYVHVLHMEDEEALIQQIKERYERKLREVFGC
ncbi:Na+/H+ antiporter subunit E [Hahella sp. CCB-MM4]|uniref:Na+/H+ antiporter subunit E n=1 Tax=Hahella sp. (strain CCB-MM4) TaxID=1926491 RepID=UPI000B9AAD24|nr:Na+/H+ antiporter subunit E [Hahella sp. CCB-MM4]OZG72854.1 Na+/H+ antiporter subunit E [Hahella sp. CCB-MM4]